MKYMLLMMTPSKGWEAFNAMPVDDIKAHIRFMHDVNRQLKDVGELVDAQGLAFPDQAKIVRSKSAGTVSVTDGPFPESKEFLAGYWIVDVDSPERAVAIAAHVSTAPGKGGTPMGLPVEVRQVMSAPPVEV